MGPMITEGEAKRVERWVAEAGGRAPRCYCGGTRGGRRHCHPADRAHGVPHGDGSGCKEVFGPTVNLWPFDTLEEAVEAGQRRRLRPARGDVHPLVDAAHYAITDLECGGVIVNDSTDYRLDQMPFGGIKSSGLGREGVKFVAPGDDRAQGGVLVSEGAGPALSRGP